RPDFIFTSISGIQEHFPSVAVFCDGFEYHACPGRPQGRISDDIRKRLSLVDSPDYVVWSITWDDVETSMGGKGIVPAPFGKIDVRNVEKALAMKKCGLAREIGVHPPFELLLDFLRQPVAAAWCSLASSVVFATFIGTTPITVDSLQAFRERLKTEACRFVPELVHDPQSSIRSYYRSDPWAALLLEWNPALQRDIADARGTLRIFDEVDARNAPGFKTSWQTFLAAWNLLQFLDDVEVTGSEGMVLETPSLPAALPLVRKQEGDPALAEAFALADPSCHDFLAAWHAGGNPLPEVGVDIASADGRILTTLELAWPDSQVGVVLQGQEGAMRAAEAAGWTVLTMPIEVEAVQAALNCRMAPATGG
ncbi:MAG: hypothetical protein ACYCW6_28440, partial [Candidatus Xenobia bacterium]